MKPSASIRILSGLFALALACPALAADGLTVLHTFQGWDGKNTYGRLVQGPDGAFYGTNLSGGAYGLGNVYKVGVDGSFEVLHSFKGPDDGTSPNAGLVLMDDGNFYGTTGNWGPCQEPCASGGTVFRMTPDGMLTTLHTFAVNTRPYSLAAGSDGLMYGVTGAGGSLGYGSIYSIATDGTYRLLVSFDRTAGIWYPQGRLVEGTDGNLYGTTINGGTYEAGTVFRMTPDGAITLLHSINGTTDGDTPYAGLVQGDDGRFYGGTQQGGSGFGTLFAITADGDFTVLHAFNHGDGSGLEDALVQGSDGYLYGTSGVGGDQNAGTLFRLTRDGRLSTLHLFSPGDVSSPATAPILGSDGRLYGTTAISVYAFDLAAPRMPEVHLASHCTPPSIHNDCLGIRVGADIRLEWASANVAACRASGAWNGIRRRGGIDTFPAAKTGTFVYRMDCTGPNGHVSAQTVVTVIR